MKKTEAWVASVFFRKTRKGHRRLTAPETLIYRDEQDVQDKSIEFSALENPVYPVYPCEQGF
jgi:hypothetical protein